MIRRKHWLVINCNIFKASILQRKKYHCTYYTVCKVDFSHMYSCPIKNKDYNVFIFYPSVLCSWDFPWLKWKSYTRRFMMKHMYFPFTRGSMRSFWARGLPDVQTNLINSVYCYQCNVIDGVLCPSDPHKHHTLLPRYSFSIFLWHLYSSINTGHTYTLTNNCRPKTDSFYSLRFPCIRIIH